MTDFTAKSKLYNLKQEKKKKDEKFTIRDMATKVLLEKGGIYEDDDLEKVKEQPQEWT